MKKYLLTFAFLIGCALNTQAGIDLGVTGGYNLTQMKLDKATWSNTLQGKNGSGWYIGPKVNIGLVLGLSVEAAALYNQREYRIEDAAGAALTEKSKSIDLPVMAKFTLPMPGFGIYVKAGPQFSFPVGDNKLTLPSVFGNNTSLTLPKTDIFEKEKMSTTLTLGAGVRLMKKLELGVAYNMALDKTSRRLLENVGLSAGENIVPAYKLNTFSVQASYYF